MKIAIQGHPTRGKEIAQIFKSLGGKSIDRNFAYNNLWYYLNSDSHVNSSSIIPIGYKEYTLEEFEKEFPFKVGDKVRDYSDDEIGTILGFIDIEDKLIMYVVNFEKSGHVNMPTEELKPYKEMKEERNITLTIDKAKEWYKKGGELKEIALQAFSEKELTKVELPKTWEEFCISHPRKKGESYASNCCNIITLPRDDRDRDIEMDKNICPSEKSAEAHLAMIQLEQLRDCWRQGWEPDWNDDQQTKYCIVHSKEFKIHILYETRHFLSFPTIEMAKKFLECFRDLIEKARDLI